MPTLLLLLGLFTLFRPSSIASAPLLVIGWAMLVYGVVEAMNAFKVSNNRRKWKKMQEIKTSASSSDKFFEDATFIEEK